MPKCEECEHRFYCFTTKNRPKRVAVNWEISASCEWCTHAKLGYGQLVDRVGLCTKRNLLIHSFSTCGEFERSSRMANIVKIVYRKLRDELSKTKYNGKLPKYCIDE